MWNEGKTRFIVRLEVNIVEKTLKIDNCMDCPHHLVRPDPDPDDWFCDDDEKVVCTQVQTKDGTNRDRKSVV